MFNLEKLQQASETDLQIANYISNNEASVAFMRVRELAEQTHVSAATIIRFTKKMGFDSFPELRLAIKQKLAQQASVQQKSQHEFYLEETLFPSDFKQKIQLLIEILHKASLIHCLGTGSSNIMSQYAQQRFSSLGYRSIASVSAFVPYLSTKNEHHEETINEVCLLFSVSGETPEIIQIAKGLVDTPIYSVSITNKETNRLATLSDLSISYDTELDRQSFNVDFSSQLPTVYIIEMLAKALYSKKYLDQ